VDELEIPISLGTLQALADGASVLVEVPEENLLVRIHLDDDAARAFRNVVHRALLDSMPTPPGVH